VLAKNNGDLADHVARSSEDVRVPVPESGASRLLGVVVPVHVTEHVPRILVAESPIQLDNGVKVVLVAVAANGPDPRPFCATMGGEAFGALRRRRR
jgi:hypothetical protein